MVIKRNSKGRFIKGSSGFIGKHSEETKQKMRGKRPSVSSWNKGLTKLDDDRIKGGRRDKKDRLCSSYMKRFIDGKYILVHHIIWSENNGGIAVPKNYVIHHMDNNKLNNNINNLVLLPQDFHAKLHWEFEKLNNIKRNYKKEELE